MGVLIAGMHRSGTSMLGQWVSQLGLSAGDGPGFEVTPANPRGLYERRDVVEFDDRWLGVLGGSWWAPPFVKEQTWRSIDQQDLEVDRRALDLFRPGFQNWFAKDPRLSLLLPLWDRLTLQRSPVLMGLRSPRDVAMSLHVRNGITLRRGLALWVAYNRNLLRQAGGRPLLLLDLDTCLENPAAAVDALLGLLDAAGMPTTGDPAAVVADVRPGLVRQRSERLDGSAERLAADLDATYADLCGLHGRVLEDGPTRLPLPDWAGEALDELSEFWDLQVRRDIEQGRADALEAALARQVWRRLIPGRFRSADS